MMDDIKTRQADQELRDLALERLKKKADFRSHLLVYVVVNTVIVVIWAMTSAGFFWPVFPMLGWGIGLFFHWWDVYVRTEPSEASIAREMARLSRRH